MGGQAARQRADDPAELHRAVMELAPEDWRDREKVNAAFAASRG